MRFQRAILSFIVFLWLPSALLAQDAAMHYSELQKFLPKTLVGYQAEGPADGASVSMGGQSYTTVEQVYRKGESEMTVQLIDYKGLEQVYKATTSTWAYLNAYEDASVKRGGYQLDEKINGWRTYYKDEGRAELQIGVSERYFVQLTATSQQDWESVTQAAEALPLKQLSNRN